MKDKKVIQRALPLDTKYNIVSMQYISIFDGGCTCQNCGRLISNSATVKNERNEKYVIGLDCLETVLVNNKLLNEQSYVDYLYSDKPAIEKAKQLRRKIMNNLKKDETFQTQIFYPGDKTRFGFSFSVASKHPKVIHRKPMGSDFTYLRKYAILTLNYIKDLPGVNLQPIQSTF